MNNRHSDTMNNRTLGLALALIFLAAAYRVLSVVWLPGLPNFSPAFAMAFCAGMFLPGVAGFAAPLVALFVSDLILNAHYGQPLVGAGMAGVYACYLLSIGLGRLLRERGPALTLGAVAGNALFFYLVTNTLSWWGNVHYPQTFAGLIQSLTVGRPGFPPSWTFLRNSLVSDLIFTGLFLAVFYWARNRSASPSLARHETAS